jgi:hypothetical protein
MTPDNHEALGRALSARVPLRSARGTVKRTYEAILELFPADEPPVIFGVLAACPPLLERYWDTFAPTLQSTYMKEGIDSTCASAYAEVFRTRILTGPGPRTGTGTDEKSDVGFPSVEDYLANSPIVITPIQAIVCHAMHTGVRNAPYALEEAALPPTRRATLVSEADASPKVAAVFKRIRKAYGFPVFVPRYYEGVAAWPELLEGGWDLWEPFVGTDKFRQAVSFVAQAAGSVARGFPGTVPTVAEVTRDDGIDDLVTSDIRRLVELFALEIAPEITLSSCFFVEFLRARRHT